MNLFQIGRFQLHSGEMSSFKIECDALTDEDWNTLALIIASQVQFNIVVGISRGGIKLEKALIPYESSNENDPILVVDDVWTTGKSMTETLALHDENTIGVVVFARNPIDHPNVFALFTMMDRTLKRT